MQQALLYACCSIHVSSATGPVDSRQSSRTCSTCRKRRRLLLFNVTRKPQEHNGSSDRQLASSLPICYQLRPAGLIPTWSFCFGIFPFFLFFLFFLKKKREKGEGVEITPFSSLLFSSLLTTYSHRIILFLPQPFFRLSTSYKLRHCICHSTTPYPYFAHDSALLLATTPSCSPVVPFLRRHDAGICCGFSCTELLVFFFLGLFLFSLSLFLSFSLGLSVRLIQFSAGK